MLLEKKIKKFLLNDKLSIKKVFLYSLKIGLVATIYFIWSASVFYSVKNNHFNLENFLITLKFFIIKRYELLMLVYLLYSLLSFVANLALFSFFLKTRKNR